MWQRRQKIFSGFPRTHGSSGASSGDFRRRFFIRKFCRCPLDVFATLMIDDGCWVACRPEGASLSHMPGCAGHNSGRQGPVEPPWACWACSCLAWHVDLAASLVGQLGAEDAEARVPLESPPGHHRRHRFRCQESALARSDMPVKGKHSQHHGSV